MEKTSDSSDRVFQIVIVDDDEDFRSILEVSLADMGMDLRLYTNGDEAIAAMSATWPDMAILDIQMPGTNGIEVCQWIKSQGEKPFIPVILLTSQSEIADKVNGLNCGADDYVTKPFSLAELKARVHSFLRIKVLTDQLRDTKNKLAEKERELLVMQLAGAAAHELGQPLTTLLLDCQLLSRAPGSTEHSKVLEDIVAQCNRMREIVDQLHSLQTYKVQDYVGGLKILSLTAEGQDRSL